MSARKPLWQIGSEFHRPQVSTDDFTSWSIVASKLSCEDQLRNAKMTTLNQAIPEVSQDIHEISMRLPFLEITNSERLTGKVFRDDDGWNLGWGIGEYLNKGMCTYRQNKSLQLPEKWLKTLPPAEILPRNEILGGYIFVCNNDTMQEDLKRQLFGLPQRYRDSVRAITPGLPLFLYNYSTHQMHGIYQAVSFGGSNIDPSAWEDKKFKGESRFPAQVRIRAKKRCKPLEEDSFRPILHHYDGPKFRVQLSVPEALALLDLFMEEEK